MSNSPLETSAIEPDVPERFDPDSMHGEIIEAEHLARYHWASSLARGRRVLDAGCGTAYGSALLASAGAREVIGVDRASEVLDAARGGMPDVVTLEPGDVTSLAYEDDEFDLVVCFEVIEHLSDPGRALDEFRRVLSPDGILAVSSPNREVYPPGNPHHVHEYSPPELEEELYRRFSSVRLERQHTWITSGVLDDVRVGLGNDMDLGEEINLRKLKVDEPGAELYTVALASQRELPKASAVFELAPNVELRRWDALWHEQAQMLAEQMKTLEEQERVLREQERVLKEQVDLLSAREQVIADRGADNTELRKEIDALRRQLEEAEGEVARLPALEARADELVAINDAMSELNDQLTMRRAAREDDIAELIAISERYTVVVESTSWKLTRPLRRAVALFRRRPA